MEQTTKALGVCARRMRQSNGLFDVEAMWAIGILAAALNVTKSELEELAESYLRITFEYPGDKKIQAIKCVRSYLGIGLREAKDLVEGIGHFNGPASKVNEIKKECEEEFGSNVIVRPIDYSPPPDNDSRHLDLGSE